jgi:hypothetical protein
MNQRARLAVVVAITVVGIGAVWFMNRTVREDSSHWGYVYYTLRWGRAVEMQVDRDRNGVIEFRGAYLTRDPRYTHSWPDEAWEDWNQDGVFEKHYWMSGIQQIERLELDTDNDGTYDEILVGEDAARHFKENPWPGA